MHHLACLLRAKELTIDFESCSNSSRGVRPDFDWLPQLRCSLCRSAQDWLPDSAIGYLWRRSHFLLQSRLAFWCGFGSNATSWPLDPGLPCLYLVAIMIISFLAWTTYNYLLRHLEQRVAQQYRSSMSHHFGSWSLLSCLFYYRLLQQSHRL